jgi:hypothetical protein
LGTKKLGWRLPLPYRVQADELVPVHGCAIPTVQKQLLQFRVCRLPEDFSASSTKKPALRKFMLWNSVYNIIAESAERNNTELAKIVLHTKQKEENYKKKLATVALKKIIQFIVE